jgi:hypothetical protein
MQIPCAIKGEYFVYNPQYSTKKAVIYTGLEVKPYGPKRYLCANKAPVHSLPYFTAPEGAVVRFEYETGSAKHTYHQFVAYFLVRREMRASLRFGEGREVSVLETENLENLPIPDKKALAEIEAEILNQGLELSKYDPVKVLYYYFNRHLKKAEEPSSALIGDLETQVAELTSAIDKKYQEIRELEAKLESLRLKLELEKAKRAVV